MFLSASGDNKKRLFFCPCLSVCKILFFKNNWTKSNETQKVTNKCAFTTFWSHSHSTWPPQLEKMATHQLIYLCS